jgi:Ulp1 family protease
MDFLCQQNQTRVAKFIPNHAYLHFESKENVGQNVCRPWYWSIANVDLVLCPAHLQKNHWGFLLVELKAKKMKFYDSMNRRHADKRMEFMEKTRFFFNNYNSDFFLFPHRNILVKVAADQGHELSENGWDFVDVKEAPQQHGDTECGVFALHAARATINNKNPDMQQKYSLYYRRRICQDLLTIGEQQQQKLPKKNQVTKKIKLSIIYNL